MMKGRDSADRADGILTFNKNIFQKSIVHLYSIECHDGQPNTELQDNVHRNR